MDHARYDKRQYPIVDVREWVRTYERTGRKGVYRTLAIADVTRTGLPAGAYDLCVQSAWLRKKPRWEGRGYLGLPISFAMVWRQKYRPRP